MPCWTANNTGQTPGKATSSDVEDDDGAPSIGGLLDHEAMQGHRLDVREEGVPFGIDRLPDRIGVETEPRFALLDPKIAHPQQEPAGVLVVDELLEEFEQEEIEESAATEISRCSVGATDAISSTITLSVASAAA